MFGGLQQESEACLSHRFLTRITVVIIQNTSSGLVPDTYYSGLVLVVVPGTYCSGLVLVVVLGTYCSGLVLVVVPGTYCSGSVLVVVPGTYCSGLGF